MIDDYEAKLRRKQKQEENTYSKHCLYCGKEFIGKNKDPFGICPECETEKYCDRCCQEISYYEYMTNSGLCNECADEIEFGDDK